MKKLYILLALLLDYPVQAQIFNFSHAEPQIQSGLVRGNYNTVVGPLAGNENSIARYSNTYLGYRSGRASTTGSYNTFAGSEAGSLVTTGSNNTFFGHASGYYTTTGSYNSFIGQGAGSFNTAGIYNSFVGQSAGTLNTTGAYNTFLGSGAGYQNQTGSSNTLIGINSGYNNISSNNVMLGAGAGQANTVGNRNTFIGTNAGVSAANPDLENATAIGYSAQVSQSNSVVLGNGANVGIGTTAPSTKLHINAGTAGMSGLRLENLTSTNTASATNQTKFLTVDGSGNVILGSLNGSARQAATDVLWQRKGMFLQSQNGESIVIGSTVDNTPAGYKLFVEDGILTEKVKVAVKNTSDWSDYVFDENYPLKSLDEVGKYILANKHLPGVPSANEMVEQGNDLHKTDAKLLEKIEELTLYSIQLEKQLQQANQHIQESDKKQQAQIDELKQLVKQLAAKK